MPESSNKPRSAHLWIRGRVQGVAFRAFTRREAQRLGISGWVRNLSDGRVEAVACGEKLNDFIASCHQGPAFARVDAVDVEPMDTVDTPKGFVIRHDG